MKNPKTVVHGTIFASATGTMWELHGPNAINAFATISRETPYLSSHAPPARCGQACAAKLGCFLKPRPEEELYDTETDPHELRKLASDPSYAATLSQLRRVFAEWQRITADRLPETRTRYEFDREKVHYRVVRSSGGLPRASQLKGDNQQWEVTR